MLSSDGDNWQRIIEQIVDSEDIGVFQVEGFDDGGTKVYTGPRLGTSRSAARSSESSGGILTRGLSQREQWDREDRDAARQLRESFDNAVYLEPEYRAQTREE